jgi:SAM-dependent methyltransferase
MLLELAADACIAGGKSVAWIYRKIWSRRGLQYFDHRFDHLRGPQYTCWQERGVLGALAVPPGGLTLDLCCGEGFYTRHYYASRASYVDAIDIDPNAIRIAKRHNRHRNVRFHVGDVTALPFPQRGYDAVLFFSALHFISEDRRADLLSKVADSMKAGGTLVGSASLPLPSIAEYLAPRFEPARLWTSDWGNGRVESYFQCQPSAK